MSFQLMGNDDKVFIEAEITLFWNIQGEEIIRILHENECKIFVTFATTSFIGFIPLDTFCPFLFIPQRWQQL